MFRDSSMYSCQLQSFCDLDDFDSSSSTSFFSSPLEAVLRASTTIAITATFMLHSFFFSLSFSLCGPLELKKIPRLLIFFFLVINMRSGLLGVRDPFVSQSPRKFFVFHFLRKILVCLTWFLFFKGFHGSFNAKAIPFQIALV